MSKPSKEQVMAARAAVEAEIATLDPIVGHGTEYSRALSDGTRAMPPELAPLFSQRVRWEKLTDARAKWLRADKEAEFAAQQRAMRATSGR